MELNVLLTCAGRRHYLARYFREALEGKGKLVGTDKDLTAAALTACDRSYQVPGVFAPEYLDRIKDIIQREAIKMVFSLNDLEIGLLAERREEIEAETGARLYVPSRDAFEMCADKWRTYLFCRDLGLPAIPTFLSPHAALAAIQREETQFPVIVKPRWGSASIAIERVESAEDLRQAFARCRRTVMSSALAPLGSKDAVIIQQLIDGPEFGVDILYNASEEIVGFAAKRKLAMRAGETDKAVTVNPAPFASSIELISANLRHRGNLDCDFLAQNGTLFLLEMNPRFGGGYPFTHEAGANHVQHLIAEFCSESTSNYGYRQNVAFSKCDVLVSVPSVLA